MAAFYYTTDNGERLSENFPGEPYVSVVMFDEDENPTVAFETSPEDSASSGWPTAAPWTPPGS